MRIFWPALCAGLFPLMASGGTIVSAEFADPTTRYDHAILGDAIEWGAIDITLSNGNRHRLSLPNTRVFEDIEPRLIDVDQDGSPEIVVAETDLHLGARMSIYDETGLIAATPYIGQSHRWLSIIGGADLDHDGHIEIAYIDRPHLSKTLKIWRYDNGQLNLVASQPDLTNHKIGWDYIAGGMRDCGHGWEMVLATGDWANTAIVTFRDGIDVTLYPDAPDREHFDQLRRCLD